MIPNFEPKNARKLDLSMLLPSQYRHDFNETNASKYDTIFCEAIRTLDSKLLGELNESRSSVPKTAQKIRNFRNLLNQAYIRFSELGLSSSKLKCDEKDLYWAHRESALTGGLNYSLPSICN